MESRKFDVFVLFLLLIFYFFKNADASQRSFTIDYDNNTFLKDGKPFRYVSGSIHYARVPHQYWKDRLQKMYAGGLNAIQVYIPWNWHEPEPGRYVWDGDHDVVSFLQTAQEVGLVVILRAGPYICGEWDFGGFPSWILKKNSSIVLRSMDPGYIQPVDAWFNVLLPKLKPLLYNNGGPVIMVQIENEYGSYFTCSSDYLEHLKQLATQHLGSDALLFTTDGAGVNFLKCGAHKGVYATVDFGPGNASDAFKSQRVYEPKGPLVNSEFYTGWLDYWGGGHAHGNTDSILATLKEMMDLGANVNMYMYHGGTNFGYTSGADPPFKICPTSYDYDAPVSESGDTTAKYSAIRELLLKPKYRLHDEVKIPSNSSKKAYGSLKMYRVGSVLDLLDKISSAPVTSKNPMTMEQLNQNEGFVLYRTKLTANYSGGVLNVSCIRDRGYVMLDGVLQGIVDRNAITQLNLIGRQGQTLDILVENQGHINFGSQINGNSKGLISDVLLDGSILTQWSMYLINFTQMFDTDLLSRPHFNHHASARSADFTHQAPARSPDLKFSQHAAAESADLSSESDTRTPTIYSGTPIIASADLGDTFLNPTGWFKGLAFINGFNLGRYWPVRGPQVTLYIPKTVWDSEIFYQRVMIVELENAPCGGKDSCTVQLQDYPILNSKT